jgi:hypothetical protein
VLGLDEFHLYRRVGMLIGAQRDDELHVAALFVHVADTGVRVPLAVFRRELGAHELLPMALHSLARPRFAKHPDCASASATAALAEAEEVLVRFLADFPRPAHLDGRLVLVEVGDSLPDGPIQVRFQKFGAWPAVGISVIDAPAIPHGAAV